MSGYSEERPLSERTDAEIIRGVEIFESHEPLPAFLAQQFAKWRFEAKRRGLSRSTPDELA